jgi:hypothetical protein
MKSARSFRPGGRRSAWLALGACLGLTGCLETSLVGSVLFAPRIEGLGSERPWVPLPVSAWVTESGVEARSIEACFDPACPEPAAVGLFQARGREADLLASAAADPARLAGYLQSEGRRTRRDAKVPDAKLPARRTPQEVASADRIAFGSWAGFAIRQARRDGTREAHSVVLVRRFGQSLSVVLVVAGTAAAARLIAEGVAAAQRG